MLKIKLLTVGTIKEKYFIDAIEEYSKRLSRFCKFIIKEVGECAINSKISVEKIKEVECERLTANLEGFVVALDKSGMLVTSEDIASILEKGAINCGKITFVIGGSFGLTKEFLNKADVVISFGKVTYPHQLMRVVISEQIYRAETILNNITYHK